MRQDKNKALNLRKQGKSYSEIEKVLDVPKSTLSFWLKDIPLSARAKQRLKQRVFDTSIKALINRNKRQTIIAKEKSDKIIEDSAKTIREINKKELKILGISLYWAEGYKQGVSKKWKCVDFSNSDPVMIKIMMRFFREICEVKEGQFKIQLMLHNNDLKNKSLRFWQKITGIPVTQFMKVSIINSSSSKQKREKRIPYGTIHIRIYNTDLFHKIIGWIEGLKLNTGV